MTDTSKIEPWMMELLLEYFWGKDWPGESYPSMDEMQEQQLSDFNRLIELAQSIAIHYEPEPNWNKKIRKITNDKDRKLVNVEQDIESVIKAIEILKQAGWTMGRDLKGHPIEPNVMEKHQEPPATKTHMYIGDYIAATEPSVPVSQLKMERDRFDGGVVWYVLNRIIIKAEKEMVQ